LVKQDPDIEFSIFWTKNSSTLKLLTKLVLQFNILVASSVPSESSFSEAGYIQNKNRASMHPNTLEYCMVLKHADQILEDPFI
jgi:hypothetical protein